MTAAEPVVYGVGLPNSLASKIDAVGKEFGKKRRTEIATGQTIGNLEPVSREGYNSCTLNGGLVRSAYTERANIELKNSQNNSGFDPLEDSIACDFQWVFHS